jgi:flagellar hook-length control protein FliK
MMHRLHFEEAQQSSYAIAPARAGSEVKDEKESESLAAEFQSLLAQISGQVAALPDQLTALSFALAQTVALERPRQIEDRNSEPNQEGAQDSGADLMGDTDTTGDGPISDLVDNRLGTRREQPGAGQQSADGIVDEQVEEVAVTSPEVRIVADDGGQVVQEFLSAEHVEGSLVTSQLVTADDQITFEQFTAQATQISEVNDEVSTTTEHNRALSAEVVDEHVDATPVVVKQVGQTESPEEVVTEDPFAQDPAAGFQKAEVEANIRKNPLLSGEKIRSDEQSLPGAGNPVTDTQARPSEQHAGGRHPNERQFNRPEDTISGQLAKGSDPGKKAAGRGAELQDVAFAAATSPVDTKPDQRRPESTIQLLLLRQAFEGLKAARNGMADQTQLKPSTQVTQGVNAAADTKATQGESGSRGKPLTRPQVTRMLERVESTLKEAARGRDGKTISLHLEPVDLGKVKVDVSLREGTLHARISPENPQVVQALREHAHELQGALRKLGLEVDSVTVSVTAEDFSGEMATGQEASDGRSFQQDRNNMPHERAQVVDNTIGNELALRSTASVESGRTGARNATDHWIA